MFSLSVEAAVDIGILAYYPPQEDIYANTNNFIANQGKPDSRFMFSQHLNTSFASPEKNLPFSRIFSFLCIEVFSLSTPLNHVDECF